MSATPNIPKYFSGMHQENDVMDAFLTQFGLKVSKMNEKTVQAAVESSKLSSKKRIEQVHNSLISSLEKFVPKAALIMSQVSTFASLASSNTSKALQSILSFCPVIIGASDITPLKTEKSLLSFFPSFTDAKCDLAIVIGFFSDCIFAILARTVIDQITAIEESLLVTILNRLFKRTDLPPGQSFGFEVLRLAMRAYEPVISRVCKIGFVVFSSYFNGSFPNRRTDPSQVSLFMMASQGIVFTAHDYSFISASVENVPKLMVEFSGDGTVMNSIFLFLCNLLPMLKDCHYGNLVEQIQKKTETFIKSSGCWRNSLRLMGVIHYLKFPQNSKRFTRLLEKKVYPRLAKEWKVRAALDYLIALLRPSEHAGLNWSPQVSDFVKQLYPRITAMNISNCGLKVATLLEAMAALNLPSFISEWLPVLLQSGSAFAAVTLRTVSRIVNPLSGFQQHASTVPTNTTVNIRTHILNILRYSAKFITAEYQDQDVELTNEGFDFIPAVEILESFHVADAPNMDALRLSPKVLRFLLETSNCIPVRPLPRVDAEEIQNSQRIVEESLKQWHNVFDTPHEHYGDLCDMYHLPLVDQAEVVFGTDFWVISIIPIILANDDPENDGCVSALIKLILSPYPSVSALASTAYEVLCLSFIEHSSYYLRKLGQFTISAHKFSAAQLHQLSLTFYHCLAISVGSLKDESVLDITEFIAFLCLNSPFPETRCVGMRICETSYVLSQILGSVKPTLHCFLLDTSERIEGRVIVNVVSTYSSFNANAVPIHKLPTIQLRSMIMSPSLLLWRFALVEIAKELLNSTMHQFVLNTENHFLANTRFIEDQQELNAFAVVSGVSELNLLINILSALFCWATNIVLNGTKDDQRVWRENEIEIRNITKSLVTSSLILKEQYRGPLSFALCHTNSLNIGDLLLDVMGKFLQPELTISEKDKVLEFLSLLLRKFASSPEFPDYIGRMIQSNLVNQLMNLLDSRIQLFIQLEDYDMHDQLLPFASQLTDYLIFCGHYFKYLHQSRLETPHGPIPRCAFSLIVDEREISPVCDRQKLFTLLFKWGQLGLTEFHPAFTKKERHLMEILGHVSRMTVTYLASLGPVFQSSDIFDLNFLNAASCISKHRRSFLQHFLTHHFTTFLDEFMMAGMVTPLDVGCTFLRAVSEQFVPPHVKDSMIYSHDTFVNYMASADDSKLTPEESKFVEFLYLRTGKILLLGLIFLLHPEMQIRQYAMRMLVQICPVLLLIHTNGDSTQLKDFMAVTRTHISLLTTNISSLRMENSVDFSKKLASLLPYCTEQLLETVFEIIPKVSNTRRHCTRMDIIELATPWLCNISFDLNRYVVMKNPSRFFVKFSPHELVHKLVKCLTMTPSPQGTFAQWKALASTEDNLRFIAMVLSDIGPSQVEERQYIIGVITYIFRINPSMAIETMVPFVSYANWYFQYIQLVRFEEIADMSKFVNAIDDGEAESSRFHAKDDLDCGMNRQIMFVLDVFIQFIEEDLSQLGNYLPALCCFCLIHIKLEKCMEVLRAIVNIVRESFDSGVPEFLFNACDLLSKISAVEYHQLSFLCERTDSPLRYLQDRKVSLVGLAEMVTELFPYVPVETDETIADNLLIWALACGDIETAAVAAGLYVSLLDKEVDEKVVLSFIEDICSVVRCISTKEPSNTTSYADYLNALLSGLCFMNDNCLTTTTQTLISELVLSLLKMRGPVFDDILENALNLVIRLHETGHFVDPGDSSNDDFLLIFKRAIVQIFDHPSLLCRFAAGLIPFLTETSVLVKYLLSFLPCLFAYDWTIVEGVANQFANAFTSAGNPALARVLRTCPESSSFCGQLFSSIDQDEKTLLEASALYRDLMLSREESRQLMPVLFQLADGILRVMKTHAIYRTLMPLIVKASLGEEFDSFQEGSRLATDAFSGDFTADSVLFISNDTMPESVQETSACDITTIAKIGKIPSEILHSRFKKGGICRMSATSIDSYPIMFPFDAVYFDLECVQEITTLCKGVLSTPFTEWSGILYKAQNISDTILNDQRPLVLNLKLPFQQLIEGVLEEVMNDSQEEEDEATEKLGGGETEIAVEPLAMSVIRPISFLPSVSACNAIVEAVAQSKVKVMPARRLSHSFIHM